MYTQKGRLSSPIFYMNFNLLSITTLMNILTWLWSQNITKQIYETLRSEWSILHQEYKNGNAIFDDEKKLVC